MKRKWLVVVLASAVVISAFYLSSPMMKKEETATVPALSFLKNDDSKTLAYHYRKWKEVKVANGEDSGKSTEYQEKHDEPLTNPTKNGKDDELTMLVYNYFHDENIYLMDSSDTFFTSSDNEKMTNLFENWKEGKLSTADLIKEWEGLLSTNSNGLHFEKPFVLKQEVERKEMAFEQLRVMEQAIMNKVTTTTPALFHVEMMYNDSKDVYTLYLIGVSQS